jgi:hypothetical protein
MYSDRVELYKELEQRLKSKLLVYVTGDRQGFETQISTDAIDIFIDQLDKVGIVDKISLYLYTRGGNTAAAWNMVNLIRQYCNYLQVVIPHKAHSAGTLISIGANSIIMTKQATLGPIDPSINTPLNPTVSTSPTQMGTYPVSVEAVKGYIEFAKDELNIKDDSSLIDVMLKLSEFVHPLVLGQVYRSRAQIKMLAEKLLSNQIADVEQRQKIISFLCSDSGSHDYTINRREAKASLGLNVDKPDSETYTVIKAIYDSISKELGFGIPFNIQNVSNNTSGEYTIKRSLVESIIGGSNSFLTEGKIAQITVQVQGAQPQPAIQNNIIFEGWKHETNITQNADDRLEQSAV